MYFMCAWNSVRYVLFEGPVDVNVSLVCAVSLDVMLLLHFLYTPFFSFREGQIRCFQIYLFLIFGCSVHLSLSEKIFHECPSLS